MSASPPSQPGIWKKVYVGLDFIDLFVPDPIRPATQPLTVSELAANRRLRILDEAKSGYRFG